MGLSQTGARIVQVVKVSKMFQGRLDHISFRRYVPEHQKYVHSGVFLRPPIDFDFEKASTIGLDPEDPDADLHREANETNLRRACTFSTRGLLLGLTELFQAEETPDELDETMKVPEIASEMVTHVDLGFFTSMRRPIGPSLSTDPDTPSLRSASIQNDSFHEDAKLFLRDKIEFVSIRSARSSVIPRTFQEKGFFRTACAVDDFLHTEKQGMFQDRRIKRAAREADREYLKRASFSEGMPLPSLRRDAHVERARDDVLEEIQFNQCGTGQLSHWYSLIQMEHFDLWLEMTSCMGDPDAEPGSNAAKKSIIVTAEVAKRESDWPVDEDGVLIRSNERDPTKSGPIPTRGETDYGLVEIIPGEEFSGLTGLGLMRLIGYVIVKADHYHVMDSSCQTIQKWLFTKRRACVDQALSATPNHRWCACDVRHPSHSRSIIADCVMCGENRASYCANDNFLCFSCLLRGCRPPTKSALEFVQYDTAEFWRSGDGRGRSVPIHQRMMGRQTMGRKEKRRQRRRRRRLRRKRRKSTTGRRKRRKRKKKNPFTSAGETEIPDLDPSIQARFVKPEDLDFENSD